MTILTVLLLAANLAVLYFVFDISQSLRQILTHCQATRPQPAEFPLSVNKWSILGWLSRHPRSIHACAGVDLSVRWSRQITAKMR